MISVEVKYGGCSLRVESNEFAGGDDELRGVCGAVLRSALKEVPSAVKILGWNGGSVESVSTGIGVEVSAGGSRSRDVCFRGDGEGRKGNVEIAEVDGGAVAGDFSNGRCVGGGNASAGGVSGDGTLGGVESLACEGVTTFQCVVPRGKNYWSNKRKRDKKRVASRVACSPRGSEEAVPEWRRKFATGELADTWAERKVRENRIAILKADEQIRRLESGAGVPRLQSKLSEAEQEAKVRSDYVKHMEANRVAIVKAKADQVYWQKRQEAGAVEKAIKLEMEIMDGQISGKYDPFTPKRTIGWAKTVRTNSSTGSSAKKTVWSGSGASGRVSSASQQTGSVISLEKHERILKEEREKVVKKKESEIQVLKKQLTSAVRGVREANKYWEDKAEFDCDW